MSQAVSMAIIGGSGFYQLGMLAETEIVEVETPYGVVKPIVGYLGELRVAFMPRHGAGHTVLPHQVNYRANLWGLKQLGVKQVIATTAVGSLDPKIGPGSLVMIDQFLDFTKQRPLTFFDHQEVHKAHVDVTEPYCRALRAELHSCAEKLKIPHHFGGCYVCTEGPRYETAAEIKMYQMLGGTVIGMTAVPEVVLARELGICYANLSIVTNWAAGIGATLLNHQEVVEIMGAQQSTLRELITKSLALISCTANNCDCRRE